MTGEEFRYRLDRSGRQRFNFAQRVWLQPSVSMAFTSAYSPALATLAVNLLSQVLRGGERQVAIGSPHRLALALARAFAEDCLLTAPYEGWVIPRATIRAWVQSRSRRPAQRARAAARRPCGARASLSADRSARPRAAPRSPWPDPGRDRGWDRKHAAGCGLRAARP